MAYTTINKGEDHFNTALTTGTGSSQAVTGLGFQPDWIWGKRRDSTGHNSIFDSVRGITKGLETNQTNAEFTSTDYYSSFDSDGFTIAAGASGAGNGSSQTAAQWCWKAGSTSVPSGGSITPTAVSINTTAGFGIYAYVGTGSDATIAHGLGGAPKFIITKNRDTSTNWPVQLSFYTAGAGALNEDTAFTGNFGDYFNAVPTSTLINLGDTNGANKSGDKHIMYAFREIQGYSKFGEYGGTSNADGPFVYTGFKPAWVMIKMKDGTDNWQILDNKRSPFNIVGGYLLPDSNQATINNDVIDFTSNGFKLRTTAGSWNNSSYDYMFMAFAEHPFVSSTGTPVAAR